MADLQYGSALIAARGVTPRPENFERVERIVGAFGAVGKALEFRRAIPYSSKVVDSAAKLVGLINGAVTAITFETPTDDATVTSAPAAVGSVTGSPYAFVRRG